MALRGIILSPGPFAFRMSRLALGFALVLTSCAVVLPGAAHASDFTVTPAKARPGDLVVLALPLPAAEGAACPSGTVGDREVQFHVLGGKCQALVALPVEAPEGELAIRLGKGEGVSGTVTVLPPAFNVRELTVAKKYVAPPAKVKKRMAQDRAAFARAFGQKPSGPLFTENFDWPRRDVMTAPFGDLRTFNGKKQSQHYGMDIDGRIGDPVYAANAGEVVMVRDNYAAGRTVMLHHGLDVYTTYFHLSDMDVKVGQKVKKGDLLGKVGKSGRVTGPHLHFGVKVGGRYVDPASVMRADLLGTPLADASPQPPATATTQVQPASAPAPAARAAE